MLKPVWISVQLLERRQQIILGLLVLARSLIQLLDVVGLAAVGLLGAMLASGLTGRPTASFIGLDVSVESSGNYLWVAGSVAAFFLTKTILATVLLRLTTAYLARIEAKFSAKVAQYVFSGDLARLRRYSRGEINWVVDGSSNVAFSNLLYFGASLVTEITLFISVFVVLVYVDLSTAIIITIYFLILFLVFQVAINGRLREIGKRISENNVLIADVILDMVEGFKELMVLEKRGLFLERFYFHRRQKALDFGSQRFLNGIPRFFIESALMVGVMGLIAWQFARGNLSEGIVVAGVFVTGGLRMMGALLPLQAALAGIRMLGPQAAQAQEILTEVAREPIAETALRTSNLSDTDKTADSSQTTPLDVVVEDLSFAFPDEKKQTLSHVSFRAREGSFCAIIGPSGAGKTTLVDIILGLQEPTAGRVLLGGINPTVLRKSLPGSIAYVPQSPGIVSGSLASNIALGVPAELVDEKRMRECLAKAQLLDFVDSLPNGVNSSLGKHTEGLSGGQIQRLGIARALYSEPSVLILDEATSALDAATEWEISKTIENLDSDLTVIVVAHRLSTIQNADLVVVLDAGQVVATGSFESVRQSVPFVENYVNLMRIKE